MREKIWVLTEPTRPGAGLDTPPTGTSGQAKGRPTGSSREREALESPSLNVHEPKNPEAWIKVPVDIRRPFDPVVVLLALYTLGGMAPLALRIGARKFVWAAASIMSLTTWVTLVWHWQTVQRVLASGRLPLLPFLLGLVVATGMGVLAWCRALRLAGRDDRYRPERLPHLLKHSWVAGAAGLVVPGSGLLMAASPVRASFAFWNAACVAASLAILANAPLIWTWNARAGSEALPRSFGVGRCGGGAGGGAAGGLVWVGGALDGARRIERFHSARARARARRRSQSRGDQVAVALLVSIVALAASLRPAQRAREFDCFATALRYDGYQLVPLTLQSAAVALDPSRPEYAMRLAEIQVERGHRDAARAIHARLRESWDVYAQTLLRQETPEGVVRQPQPIEPNADVLRARSAAPRLVRIPPPVPANEPEMLVEPPPVPGTVPAPAVTPAPVAPVEANSTLQPSSKGETAEKSPTASKPPAAKATTSTTKGETADKKTSASKPAAKATTSTTKGETAEKKTSASKPAAPKSAAAAVPQASRDAAPNAPVAEPAVGT